MKNSETRHSGNLFNWLIFVFFTVLLPVIAGWFGWNYIASVHRDGKLRMLQQEANNRLESLQLAADGGKYACLRINEVFEASYRKPEELRDGIEALNKEMALQLQYLIWNGDGSVFHANFDHRKMNADWPLAFHSFCDINGGHYRIGASETANIRRIFGPQFFPEVFSECYSGRHIQPLFGDSTPDGRLSWIRVRQKRIGLSVFFSRSALENLPGIEHQIASMRGSNGLQIVLIRDGNLKKIPGLELTASESAAISETAINYCRTHHWYVFKGLIRSGIEAAFLFPAASVDLAFISAGRITALLLLAFLALILIYRSYLAFCRGCGINISIRKQLIILFALSNSLSLGILAILGFDYLHEYEILLQAETFRNGMTYLQSIDEMHVAEFSDQIRRLDRGLSGLRKALKNGPPDREMVAGFLAIQQPDPFRMVLIGSHTPFIGSEYGVMKDGNFLNRIQGQDNDLKQMKVLIESMGKLGRYYLSLLNRESIDEMIVAQVELIAESLGQLQSIEMFQEFFAATGSFWQWGMGWRYYPAYIQVLRLFNVDRADYVFLYLWEPRALEYAYIKRMFTDLNRNPLGLKVMAVNEDLRFSFPDELLQHEQLLNYTSRLREKTGTEIDFCDWQGKRHLLMGLKCLSLASMRLLGLFPVDAIERAVRGKLRLFIALGLVSMLVSLALSLVMSRSILRPLGELQTGVIALQKQDFAYRLPDLGRDEFGHLAQIFNTTLVDLEELHTASMVQEKLIDSFSAVKQHGRLKIFGGSRAMISFGGDFLALNPVDERHFGLFAGDVVGSGVASTLVMAFVKACIMQLGELYLQPQEILTRIDLLMRSSSNSGLQRKFMSLQYVLIDAESDKITIAGAGNCSPVLLKADKSRHLIGLPSTPLGAGKSAKISLCALNLQPGDKLVFYTAGLYRNAGLGFERMLDTLSGIDLSEPDAYYLALNSELETVRRGCRCDDDQTVVIISMPEEAGG